MPVWQVCGGGTFGTSSATTPAESRRSRVYAEFRSRIASRASPPQVDARDLPLRDPGLVGLGRGDGDAEVLRGGAARVLGHPLNSAPHF